MKKLLFGILAIAVLVVGVVAFQATETVLAQKEDICKGIEATGGSCNQGSAEGEVNSLVATVINIFSWVVGVVAVIFVIFGGFKYITSGGDSSKVSSAKNTIIYALIGLVIVALAQVIVVFVLNTVT